MLKPLRVLARSSFLVLFVALAGSSSAFAQHKGIGFQATLKKPDGTYPTASGLTVTLQILDPMNYCVLREEVHAGVSITNGYLHLVLGAVTPSGGFNPTPVLTMAEVMDNSTPKSNLTCVNGANVPVSTGASYSPSSTHARKLRIMTNIGAEPVVADFNLRATAYAINAENLDGKSASAFLQTSAATTQSNVESIFLRYNVLDSILNGTYAGNAATATALATAPGACPAGQYLSAMSASGTITCGTPAGGAGTVTAVSSANSYLSVVSGSTTPVLTLNVGTAANTVAAGNDSRFTDSRAPNGAAGGDLSGTYPSPTVAKISGKSVVLTSPANGEVLKYDGTNFVNATISTADATKLPLAGGTMTGAIDMGSQNLTSTGFITMSANKNLHLSNNASDPTGLVAADKGKVWFDSTNGNIKFWDGTAAKAVGVATALTADRIVTTSSGGAIQTTSCAQNQVITFTVSGAITCANVSTLSASFLNGKNAFGAAATLGTSDAFGLKFATNNVDRMTILANGNVGIGTATPIASLMVDKSFGVMPAAASHAMILSVSGTGAATDNSNMRTLGIEARAEGANDFIDVVGINVGVDNSTTSAGSVPVISGISANVAITNSGSSSNAYGYRSYAELVSGTSGSITNELRHFEARTPGVHGAGTIATSVGLFIEQQKVTGVGTGYGIVQLGTTDENYFQGKFHIGASSVAGGTAVAKFQNANGTCSLTPASSGSGIACSSDERLKENFKDVSGGFALDRLLKLQAVTYNFKTSPTADRKTGYRAQQVQKIAPEFVRENDDGYLQVYYDAFIPWITEAIKYQSSELTQLRAENKKLQHESAAIKSYLCVRDPKAPFCE